MVGIMMFFVFLLSFPLVACNPLPTEVSEKESENPTAEEIMSENQKADIFVVNGLVYSNAEDIEWVNEKQLTLGELVGEIKKQTTEIGAFENLTASKLPIGTKIYNTVEKSDIYIVKVKGEEIRYLGLIEG